MFYQDRRDEGIYWLYKVDHTDTISSEYFIGGWGTETDHLRETMMFGQVQASYQRAREYSFEFSGRYTYGNDIIGCQRR